MAAVRATPSSSIGDDETLAPCELVEVEQVTEVGARAAVAMEQQQRIAGAVERDVKVHALDGHAGCLG
jgi:hypothetical protein